MTGSCLAFVNQREARRTPPQLMAGINGSVSRRKQPVAPGRPVPADHTPASQSAGSHLQDLLLGLMELLAFVN